MILNKTKNIISLLLFFISLSVFGMQYSNVNQQLEYGYTPLILAAARGNLEEVQTLLTQGADVCAQDANKETALIKASFNGHTKIVELLLDYSAPMDTKSCSGRTALIWAAENGHFDIVKLLLKQRANLEIKDMHGYTALSYAVYWGNAEIALYLVQYGANLSAINENEQGLRKDVQEKIKTFKKEIVENLGIDPLRNAVRQGHAENIQVLLAYRTSTEEILKLLPQSTTALITVASCGYFESVQFLLDNGAQIDTQNDEGHTALISAAKNGHFEVVKLLVEKGANIDIKDERGDTALFWAVFYDRQEIARYLCRAGADLAALNESRIEYMPQVQWAFKKFKQSLAQEG